MLLPGVGAHLVPGVEDVPVDVLRVRQEGPACLGQRDAGRAAVEQFNVKFLLETADLIAQRRLGAVQLPCRAGKIQRPAHGQKTEQLVVVHGKVPLSYLIYHI